MMRSITPSVHILKASSAVMSRTSWLQCRWSTLPDATCGPAPPQTCQLTAATARAPCGRRHRRRSSRHPHNHSACARAHLTAVVARALEHTRGVLHAVRGRLACGGVASMSRAREARAEGQGTRNARGRGRRRPAVDFAARAAAGRGRERREVVVHSALHDGSSRVRKTPHRAHASEQPARGSASQRGEHESAHLGRSAARYVRVPAPAARADGLPVRVPGAVGSVAALGAQHREVGVAVGEGHLAARRHVPARTARAPVGELSAARRARGRADSGPRGLASAGGGRRKLTRRFWIP